MTLGLSDGTAYEDGLDLRLGRPIEDELKTTPIEREQIKQTNPDLISPHVIPTYVKDKFKEEIIRNILAPGVPQGPTEKQIDPGQLSPTHDPNNPNSNDKPISNFPNVYSDLDKRTPKPLPLVNQGGSTLSPMDPGTQQMWERLQGIKPLPLTKPGEKLGGNVDINTDYNVKSGAIASKDTDTVYIDPKIPAEFHPYLAEHENVEKSLMAPPRSLPYDKAHKIATLAEKHMVEQAGMNWKTYTDAVDPHVAAAEKGKGNPPPGPFQVSIEDAIGHHASSAKTLEAADEKIGASQTASDVDERPVAGQQYAAQDTKNKNTLTNMGVEMSGGKGGGGYSAGGNVKPLVRKPANENDPRFSKESQAENKAAWDKVYEDFDKIHAKLSADMVEKVDRPAIKVGDRIFEGKPGEGHFHIMSSGEMHKLPGRALDTMESGWMTNKGRYVDREEAMKIAKKAEQLDKPIERLKRDDFSKEELISEDFTGTRASQEPSPMISASNASMKEFLDALSKFIPRRK